MASRWLTVHQLRHTRGTEMVEQRYPLHVVQKTLDHRDPRSTQVYVELAEDQLRHEGTAPAVSVGLVVAALGRQVACRRTGPHVVSDPVRRFLTSRRA